MGKTLRLGLSKRDFHHSRELHSHMKLKATTKRLKTERVSFGVAQKLLRLKKRSTEIFFASAPWIGQSFSILPKRHRE